MANPRKSIFDQAGSYYLRQNYFAYNLRREEVEDLDARKNISDRAKWTWVRLKFVLLKCEEPGWLVENGEPMTIQSLATILRRRQPDTLRKDLEELLQNGILKLHDGFICDPRIVAEEADRRRKAGKSAETSDDFLEDSSETSGKHQKQTSAGADVSNPPNGSGEGSSGDPVSKQTSANSNSTTNSTTKRSTMSSSTVVNSTDTRKDSAPDARESSVTRTTDNSPDFGAFSESRRHAADYWITEELREMFGHLDLQAEVTRWLEKSANTPGWKLTAEKLRKFLAASTQ